ncbi:ankyrin repeat domain-containing protein [Burkholderia vietnamiensis]|uniref:Ankyrin repeat domain-containing protein n=1 Tax=Burkholderia vietnamiensis TaxID=60552 RepID=A0AAW7SZE6_BURVI|nr:ankyrin repeat domain-containing protein [Burkholderia vietnamiensis]MBH9645821.1 ankyrin repeat domain-containing protein [Burkholderia vietnamiensis]MBR8008905.1 ankyrin repeat domain-containing protein [Burkholderia vietnamiensis]MDN7551277.1 ankyrin repeat domain-containing protein [Burkholderia vietnamiensis]MDN7795091.1 ankyrin repeat domain-containing protein [Burkholderia vietnamiensis]MDN8043603.1 ankyrin repeat domain-containing protein [Burkholderia vietnamiensis]
MTKETAIPRLGHVLRILISAAGYGKYLANIGLDKNLDDLAAEAKDRQSSASALLERIEQVCCEALTLDCGSEWAQFLRQAWLRTRSSIQLLAQHVDTTLMPPEHGAGPFVRNFVVPMLSGFMRLTVELRGGPDLAGWWTNPLRVWISFAAKRTGLDESSLLDNLANEIDADRRTIERWLSGERIGKIGWPYAPKVAAALGKPVSELEVQYLAGWLMMACAYQSLSLELRDAVRSDFAQHRVSQWTLGKAIDEMNHKCFQQRDGTRRTETMRSILEIEEMFSGNVRDHDAIRERLQRCGAQLEQAPSTVRVSCGFFHDWFSARHVALLGDEKRALALYGKAVSAAWWRAGPNQRLVLDEALQYAVGVGDKDAANAYWDKTFMLGLNHWPKRQLDEQEMRRVAFAFERHFQPHRAKVRIPPPVEIRSAIDAFKPGPKHLASPNQKTKYAEGRTRRTPLMMAIMEGSLDDVKRLVDVGGDPNDFIPESGEGPLSYAMRRACDRRDTSVMDYLLEFDLQQVTVNRHVSTRRETPLKLAVEMAYARAVARLIELGADVEAACDTLPSALCYAMTLFNVSLHRNDPTQEHAYFAGKTRADAYDAKKGAVLDVDLAACRDGLQQLRNGSDRNRRMWKAVLDYFIRPPEAYREVIRVLLTGKVDTNRRYRVEAYHSAQWTPTLLAAEIGDLDVFRMLVEHGGDPDLTLTPANGLERFDALWVAVDHERPEIVSYLLERKKRSG